jgi:hypothetical protein
MHYWIKPIMQKSRGNGMFGFIRQYEWKCNKCNKIKYSDYEDIPPKPNMVE